MWVTIDRCLTFIIRLQRTTAYIEICIWCIFLVVLNKLPKVIPRSYTYPTWLRCQHRHPSARVMRASECLYVNIFFIGFQFCVNSALPEMMCTGHPRSSQYTAWLTVFSPVNTYSARLIDSRFSPKNSYLGISESWETTFEGKRFRTQPMLQLLWTCCV